MLSLGLEKNKKKKTWDKIFNEKVKVNVTYLYWNESFDFFSFQETKCNQIFFIFGPPSQRRHSQQGAPSAISPQVKNKRKKGKSFIIITILETLEYRGQNSIFTNV